MRAQVVDLCRPMYRTRSFGANSQVWTKVPRLSGSSQLSARGTTQ